MHGKKVTRHSTDIKKQPRINQLTSFSLLFPYTELKSFLLIKRISMKKLLLSLSLLFSTSISFISASENTTPQSTNNISWQQKITKLFSKPNDIKIDRKEVESFFESLEQVDKKELAAFDDANLEIETFKLLTDLVKNQLTKQKNLHPRIAFLKAAALLDGCEMRSKNLEDKQAAHDVLNCVEDILNKKTESQEKNAAHDEQPTVDSSAN